MADAGPEVLLARANRRAPLIAVVLTIASAAAMLGLTNRADERFHPYTYGPDLAAAPWRVVTEAFAIAFGSAASFGNFRPLGRTVENVDYLLTELISVMLGVPVHIALGIIRIGSAVLLALLLVQLARRLSNGTDPLLPLAVGVAFPGMLVAAGALSSMVVFSGMYLQTASVIVACCTLAAAPERFDIGARPTKRELMLAALAGMGIAAFNELAWIAAPAVVAVAVSGVLVRRIPLRAAWSVAAVRVAAAGLAGFVALALPIRIYLASACAAPGATCYVASNPNLGGLDLRLLLNRMFAGLPLPAWRSGPFVQSAPRIVLGAALIAAVVFWLLHRAPAPIDSANTPAPDGAAPSRHAPWVAAVLIGATLVLAGATLSALSAIVQEAGNPWQGWREAPVAFAGWALVLGGLTSRALSRLPARAQVAAVVVIGSLGVASAITATGFQHDRDTRDPRLALTEAIGAEIASFELSADGDARRCALLDRFTELHLDRTSQTRRLREGAEWVAQARHGVAFCTEASDG